MDERGYVAQALFDRLREEGVAFRALDGEVQLAVSRADFAGMPRRMARFAQELDLALVQLEGADDKLPSELSGGMRKRAALARSLVVQPEAVLFDEPTTGLDPMTAATIGALIVRAREKLGMTSVIVSHDLALLRRVAERVAFLEAGKLRFVGTLEEAESSDDRLLRRFLAGEEEDDAA